ncbi:MAG: histidinol dehydrogenase [Chloroflexi bacterium]|nr:histidinol dehydrogenase [Chloroflexota bacterium]
MRRYTLEEARAEVLARRGLPEAELPEAIRARTQAAVPGARTPAEAVARIVEDVRREGDAALRRYTAAFDGVELADFLVPDHELDAALERLDPGLRAALELAAAQVRAFHERARRTTWLDQHPGGTVGQLIRPLERVAVYAPGGRATYPSTVLMTAVPARVAGVSYVAMISPPGRDGRIADVLLAAARVAGVDQVFRVGGAQGVAALAYGSESLPRVHKIVGPGNLFVVLAKRMLFGTVGIEGLPGPTECLVVADESASPRWIAADLLAQAEHDPLASPLLLATSASVIDRALEALERMLATAPRREIVRESLAARGAAILVPSVEAAIDFANAYAPEHLALSVANAWDYLGLVRHAGGVFVGERSVESIGDYTAGPSHVMPTGGTARFSSPLTVDDFVKITSVFSFGPGDLARLGPAAITLARAEGLDGHARAIEERLQTEASDAV